MLSINLSDNNDILKPFLDTIICLCLIHRKIAEDNKSKNGDKTQRARKIEILNYLMQVMLIK